MKLRRGEAKIGEYSKVPVTIDWDFLTSGFGMRRELFLFDKALAYLLKLLAFVILVIGGFLAFKQEQFIWENFLDLSNVLGISFWSAWALVLYSIYLGRDRKYYDANTEIATLSELRERFKNNDKFLSLELEDYLSHELLVMIDEALEAEPHNFLAYVLNYLFKDPQIIVLLERLGLRRNQYEQIVARVALEQSTHIDTWLESLLLGSFRVAVECNQEQVDLVSVFIFLARKSLTDVLVNYDVQAKEVEALQVWVSNNNRMEGYRREFARKRLLKPTSTVNRSYTSTYSPVLHEFSRDFTAEVAKGEFLISVGREKELDKLTELVQQGESSATLVVGAPGVGKTTFIRSLAVRMVSEDVPRPLRDKRLVSFEFNRAFALSEDIDTFKARVEKVLEEVASAGNIVLVLEDFDQLVSVRSEYASEVISLIIRALENYKLRIIATTNPEGFAKHIRSREALVNIFSVLNMQEPRDELAVQILLDELPRFERKYGMRIEFEALPKAVELSHNYDFERVLPDKALQLIEEACSNAQLHNLSFVDEHQIEEVVSAKVGVNVGSVSAKESQLLLHLEDRIHNRIVGQDEAVKAVAAALRRARAGLTKKNKPIASFLFFGPTGIGKTELAKALTAEYYGDEKLMIRLDMSEYQEAENLKRLIGEAKGDEFSGGYLTEAVRAKPFALILLDEVEKANVKVLDLFLQVLDEGHLTDGMGRKVSFANTIIIMTSNACSYQIAQMASSGMKYLDVYRTLIPELRKVFRVEFLNRFDKVIMFKPLLPVELLQVVALQLQKVHDVLTEKGIELKWEQAVLKEILETGYDPVNGARELRRVIQDYVEDKIAQLIIDGRVRSGSVVTIKNLSEFEVE